jgi:Carboxypeptidase regulatory-like domain
MSRSILGLFACLLALAIASPAICQELIGTVANGDGQAVQGVKIVAHSSDGRVTESAITDASGQYRMSDLIPGQYFITLDPSGANVEGQTVAGYLGQNGLTVNWSVASGLSPLASAQPGIHLASASSVSAVSAVASAKKDPPPGCKGMPGPPCGPKKSKKRNNDND